MVRIKVTRDGVSIKGEAIDVNALLLSDNLKKLGVKPDPKKISNTWISMLGILFFTLASCVWVDVFNLMWTKVATLALFLLCFLIVLVVHYNLKNWTLTTISGLGGLVIILLSLNIYTPVEIARKIETATMKKYNAK